MQSQLFQQFSFCSAVCAVLHLRTHTGSGRSPLSHDARTLCRCTAARGGRHAHSALCMVCAHTEVWCAVQRGAPTACTHCAQHAGAAMLLAPPRALSDALSKMLASCSIHYVASLCCVFPNSAHLLRSSSFSPPLSKAQTIFPRLSLRVAAASAEIQRTVCLCTLIAWPAEL